MLWNSVLSTKRDKYITLYLKDVYLGIPFDRPKYMKLPMELIPQEIIDKYNLTAFEDGGWVYVNIVRGMYGLPQVDKLANGFLQKHLSKSR